MTLLIILYVYITGAVVVFGLLQIAIEDTEEILNEYYPIIFLSWIGVGFGVIHYIDNSRNK